MSALGIKAIAAMLLAAALVAGYNFWEHRVFARGEASMKAEWDADNAKKVQAENQAILDRVAENKRAAEAQAAANKLVTKAHDDELTKVRAAIAGAPRLRGGPGLCSRSPSAAETASASGSNEASSASWLLSESSDRDIKALIDEIEETAATARAAQAFIIANGLAP